MRPTHKMLKKVELVEVTPKMAKDWLSSNKNFRKHSPVRSSQYAQMMKRGEWDVNGETIKFSPDGDLIDGQHRLFACVKANVPFETFVAYGVCDANVDAGKSRTCGQFFDGKGIKYATLASAICSNLTAIKQNGKLTIECMRGASRNFLARTELYDFYEANKVAIEQSCVYGTKLRGYVRPAIAGTMYFLFAEKNARDADWFFESLSSGQSLKGGMPVYALRQKFEKNKQNRGVMPEREVICSFIFAWNAYREGREMSRVSVRDSVDIPVIK